MSQNRIQRIIVIALLISRKDGVQSEMEFECLINASLELLVRFDFQMTFTLTVEPIHQFDLDSIFSAISSAPHFLSASEVFSEEVKGMNPIDDEHVSYIVYEPTSGSIIRNAKVCFGNQTGNQIPVRVRVPVRDFDLFEIFLRPSLISA